MNNYFSINNTKTLCHYGVLGQKWGIRRYQNEDGTLTAAGKEKYYSSKGWGHVGRAITNTSLGQRIFGVGANKGYREDKKEIKAEYQKKLSEVKGTKKEMADTKKAYKSDYKKTLGEARESAAQALYPYQSEKMNKLIQNENIGKNFAKSFLLGGTGALRYDEHRAAGNGRLVSAGAGFVDSVANSYIPLNTGEYIYKNVKNKKAGYQTGEVENKKNKIKDETKKDPLWYNSDGSLNQNGLMLMKSDAKEGDQRSIDYLKKHNIKY